MTEVKVSNSTITLKIPKVTNIPSIRHKVFPIPQNEIEELRKSKKEKLIFSFKFFDRQTEAFNLGGIETSWHISLLDSLKEVSAISRDELFQQRQHYDAHGHEWGKLDYIFNFSNEFLEQVECLQYRISTSHGRVHGFIIGNRFYIVWLDPHHNLNPDERFGGIKFFDKPLCCYDKILIDNDLLTQEKQKLKKENEELYELLDIKTK